MNLPNILSIIRIILVPIIVGLMFCYPLNNSYFLDVCSKTIKINSLSIPLLWLIAFILFIVATLTDFLDGYIARKYNMVTDFGKFLDPVADKILITSILIVFTAAGILPGFVLVIIVCRDLIIGVLREIAAKKQIAIAADKLGKWKTTFQMIGIIILFIFNNKSLAVGIYSWQSQLCLAVIYIACLLTIISMVNYIIKNKNIIANSAD
ncbi:CDP-diacylglycerol--glycerol-3-phosphate 3-phosphatidyltransferase [Spiroplasma endosymbiont of Aspidapion aeneum]|uniref:CDP-diacylglycerol--glycerol-3-phosphate 3-phosphatidyltransferase n=1 Tax=Spiroplasma endosymbiont of Aspidapion aeneum TaxID=3066276 RepID=UPI00313D860B